MNSTARKGTQTPGLFNAASCSRAVDVTACCCCGCRKRSRSASEYKPVLRFSWHC